MCNQCNYQNLLNAADLDATDNRMNILEVIGNNSYPLSASDIFKILERTGNVAARMRLIRDEKLETDREYLKQLAASKVESVRKGAERLLAGLDSSE